MWLDTVTVETFRPAVAASGAHWGPEATTASSNPLFPMCYGPGFAAQAVQGWITAAGAGTAYIALGSPWGNGHVGPFDARPRDGPLDGGIFHGLREAEVVIESWRRRYSTVRPHASLGLRPPAPEVVLPSVAAWSAALRRPAAPTTQVVAPRPTLN